MKKGFLSEYFVAVAAKRLSAVEADQNRSHQHEFNGVERLKRIFGDSANRREFRASFLYLCDSDDDAIVAHGTVTWYDARAKSSGRTGRSEHRLYFPTTTASQCWSTGDLLVIGMRPNGEVIVIVVEGRSTTENQIRWLFGFSGSVNPVFSVRNELETEQDRIGFSARIILEELGIEPEERAENYLEEMLRRFNGKFPSTREFSSYARDTLPDISVTEDVDSALLAWLDREEILFRTLERQLVAEKLKAGFSDDVDGFIGYSLSVQNRRKSRAGFALENHLAFIFSELRIPFDRNQVTENNSKPDFIFPGIKAYHDSAFSRAALTMLASKSSCKDRWRQALSEADRIPRKHLITLETGISKPQTDEMQSRSLQLVLPAALHETYSRTQRNWLMNLSEFVDHVGSKQSNRKPNR